MTFLKTSKMSTQICRDKTKLSVSSFCGLDKCGVFDFIQIAIELQLLPSSSTRLPICSCRNPYHGLSFYGSLSR